MISDKLGMLSRHLLIARDRGQFTSKGLTPLHGIVMRLQGKPALGIHPEEGSQAQRRVCGNGPPPLDDFIDASTRHASRRDAQKFQ